MFVKSVLSSWCFAFAVLLVSVTLNSRFCKYAVSFTATSLCHLSFGYDGAVVLGYHICQINVEFRWTIIQIFRDVIYADWWWHMEWLSRQVKLAPWFLFFVFCFWGGALDFCYLRSDYLGEFLFLEQVDWLHIWVHWSYGAQNVMCSKFYSHFVDVATRFQIKYTVPHQNQIVGAIKIIKNHIICALVHYYHTMVIFQGTFGSS